MHYFILFLYFFEEVFIETEKLISCIKFCKALRFILKALDRFGNYSKNMLA